MSDSPETPPAAEKKENVLVNLMLNVVLPVMVLNKCSKPGHWYSLGPKWALIVSVLIPLLYFVWDYSQRRKANTLSILGIVSILLTGGLGLLNLQAQAFAIKEAAMPLLFALVFWFSHKKGKSILGEILAVTLDMPKVNRTLEKKGQTEAFQKVLWQGTYIIIASFIFSAVANYFLAMYFMQGTTPGTPEYNAAIGKQTGWGFAVIGVPSLVFMFAAITRVTKGVEQLTGLGMDNFQK
jgi:intracellular septation protein A